MTKEQEIILTYLEESFSGAQMFGDEETKLRLSRAICAFKGNIEKEIFTKEIKEQIPF